MAENIRLITYAEQTVTPMNDAILQDVEVGQSGILYGVSISASGNIISITGGYGVIKGRLFELSSSSITVQLSSGSTLSGRLHIRLDLSNQSEPISIITQTGSSIAELTKEDDANYTNGIYEMELATFSVTTTEIANVVETYTRIRGGITVVSEANTSLNQYVDTGTYYFAIEYPPSDAPSGANGWLITLGSNYAKKQIWLIEGSQNTQADTWVRTFTNGAWTSWRRLVTENEMYYMPGDTVDAYVYSCGWMTSGGTRIFFEINLPKPLHSSVKSVTYAGTNETISIRQNGRYLANEAVDKISTLNPSVAIRENTLYCVITKPSGFGGTNTAVVGIATHMLLRFNG